MDRIVEPRRELQVERHCDVLVAGAGIAGISAALAAARQGADVILVEREWLPGGLATLGLVTVFLPLCDGKGHKVVGGIGEELFLLAVKHGIEEGHVPAPLPWLENGTEEDKREIRYQAQFSPWLFALEAERLLKAEGVRILYGTVICAAAMSGGSIRQIIVENKGGRSAIAVKSVVDATGDADICAMAGAPTARFTQGNLLASWHYADQGDGIHLQMMGMADIPDKYKADGREDTEEVKRYGGLDAEELSGMAAEARKNLLERVEQREREGKYVPVAVPVIPQIRMTRRLDGTYTQNDAQMHQHFEDSIGMIGDWRKRGPVYEIPFGTLYCGKVHNLYAAGRCISVTDDMWDITRAIPCCAVTGQAAGTAAALWEDVREADIRMLQDRLMTDGALLHE